MLCKICHINFSTKQTIKKHYVRKHKRSIVICKICDKIFNSKLEESMHRITFHELIYECKLCERTFGARKSLYRHVRKRHNVEPDMVFPKSKRTSLAITALKSQAQASIKSSSAVIAKKSSSSNLFHSLKGTVTVIEN